MARVSRNEWIKAVVSKAGPIKERDRHTCHVLAFLMFGDSKDGCFPSQHTVGAMLNVSHKTAAASLKRLVASGWLETTKRRTKFGKLGSIYFPALPDSLHAPNGEPKDSPMNRVNGESISPQQRATGEKFRANGEFSRRNGEFLSRIGESIAPLNLESKESESGGQSGAKAPTPALKGMTNDWSEDKERRMKDWMLHPNTLKKYLSVDERINRAPLELRWRGYDSDIRRWDSERTDAAKTHSQNALKNHTSDIEEAVELMRACR